MRINSFIYVYNTLQYTIMMLKTSMIYTSDKYVHDQKSREFCIVIVKLNLFQIVIFKNSKALSTI